MTSSSGMYSVSNMISNMRYNSESEVSLFGIFQLESHPMENNALSSSSSLRVSSSLTVCSLDLFISQSRVESQVMQIS